MRPIQANPPERLSKQLIALTAMKFVEEVLEISRRGPLVAFEPKQLCNLVVVQLVH
jgi:hypothetical protein